MAKMTKSPSPMSPVDIMNLIGGAADTKSKLPNQPMPDDEEDPANSVNPKAKKAPGSVKSSKAVAAMKEQAKSKGQIPAKTFPKSGA